MAAHRAPGAAALLAVLLAGQALLGQSQTVQDPPARSAQPPIRSAATFVRVDVYPTRDGRPVQGLSRDDFELREDGVLQKVETFEHVLVPVGPGTEIADAGSQRDMLQAAANPRARLVVVFLDPPHVSLFGSHAVKEPVILLVSRVLGPDDLVGLMTPEMSASQIVLGRKTQVIEELLRRNWDWGQASDKVPRLTEREHMYEMCYPVDVYGPLAAMMIAKSRQRITLEAMQDLVTYLGAIREERKAIVTVSQGWKLMGPTPSMMDLQKGPVPGREPITVGPTGQPELGNRRNSYGVSRSECDSDRVRLSQMDNVKFFRDLLDDANRANATFYPLDPGGLVAPAGGTPVDNEPVSHLRELAENTDGLAIVNSNDLSRGVRRVVDDLTSYYLLGYYSTNPKADGRFRRLQVRVRQTGVDVRARRGYRAASPDEKAASAARKTEGVVSPSPIAAAMADLSRPRTDARFRISVATYAGDGGSATIWIAGELSPPATGLDEFAAGATAELEVSAEDRSTRAQVVLEPGQRGFVTAVTVPAGKPGQVDVRARLTGEGSAAPVTDAVSAPIGPNVAQPLVFRRGPSTGNRVLPAAVLRFTRSERLRVELPVAASTPPGTARILDRAGTPLAVPVRVGEKSDPATGQRWITADLVLAPLGAGDYAIEQTPAGMAPVLTAFRVTR